MQLKPKKVSSGLTRRSLLFTLVTVLALIFNNFSGNVSSGVAQAAPSALPITSPTATQQWPEGLHAAYSALHPRVSSLALGQYAEITATDNVVGDGFGDAVSLSSDGSTALIGVYYHTVGGSSHAGAAYIFVKNGSSWSQLQELIASDYAANDHFGYAVSLSRDGSTALIGAYGHDVGSNIGGGAAYIFSKNGSSWSQLQELTASDYATTYHFGYAVSLSSDGSIALIGSPDQTVGSNGRAGAAYIFSKNGSSWGQQAKLTASDYAASDEFGYAVSLSGDGSTALIGATGNTVGSSGGSGAAYIFSKNGASWSQLQELTASDYADSHDFGEAVSLSGDGSTALIGVSYHTVSGTSGAGAAYIFGRSGASWSQQAELTASDYAATDLFGEAVSLSSDGSTALIGSTLHSYNTSNRVTGAAYIFGKNGSSWSQLQEFTASDNTGLDDFGYAVSMSSDGSTALVGSPSHNVGSNSNAGAAYIFTLSPTIIVRSNPNPSLLGTSVTFTATVSPATATGSVTFKDGTSVLGTGSLSGGVATYTTSSLSGGSHNISTVYGGDSTYASSTSNYVVQVVNSAPVTTTTYTYYLPLLANNATTPVGQTTTFVTFQNLAASAPATITVQYYGFSSGTPGGSDTLSLPAKGQQAILPNIGTSNISSGIIISSQPLNVVVSEAISSGGSAYTVTGLASATLYAPLALNGAFGGFTTNLVIFNPGNTVAAGQVQFYDANGNVAATQAFSVSSHSSQVLNQAGLSGLSNSQSYWAKISATNSSATLTAQVIELGPNNFVATLNASVPTQAATTLYAPAVFNGLYGYVTGMGFANPNPTATTITVNYYDQNGNAVGSQSVPIAANGNAGLFQGAVGTSASLASAVVTSIQPIVMNVNERGPNNVSGTYIGLGSGSTNVALPVVANGFANFVTGATILNVGNGPTNVSLSYLDASGNVVGNPQSSAMLAPHASFALYQGATNQGLPANFFGTALISSTQPLLVTTNALQNSTGLFYTYTEPSN